LAEFLALSLEDSNKVFLSLGIILRGSTGSCDIVRLQFTDTPLIIYESKLYFMIYFYNAENKFISPQCVGGILVAALQKYSEIQSQ
jgi:hypothetical protein